jgi:hypothetical protein
MATLLDLKNRVLGYLRRMPGDASIPVEMLEDAINRARRDEWRRCGGPVPDSTTLNLVAGRRDYPVAGPVSSVSWKASASSPAARLTRQTPSQIIRRWPDLTADEVVSGTPLYWTMRPVGDPNDLESVAWSALVAGSVLPAGVLSVSLWPAPDVSVTGGLIIEAAEPAAALSGDSAVSELPESVDAAACWKAALELVAFIGHEPEALQLAAFLKAQAVEAGRSAFADVMGLLADFTSIGPAAYIGNDYQEWTTGASQMSTVERHILRASYTVTVTGETQRIPCSVEPDPAGFVVVLSQQQGLVTNAVVNGAFIDVTADGGMTFYAGDVLVALYEALQ